MASCFQALLLKITITLRKNFEFEKSRDILEDTEV